MEMQARPQLDNSKAGHDSDSPPALLEFMSSGWIDQPPPSKATY